MADDDLLVAGGTVVSPTRSFLGDIRIRRGRIAEVGSDLAREGELVIDARGLCVLPGVIDAHSHQWERGSASRPDFRDDTASAAAGGITTIIDHPLTTPEVLTRERLVEKAELGERTSLVDFALHGGTSPSTVDEIPALWRAGATAIKFFTCETGLPMRGFVTDEGQRRVVRRLASAGALGIVHAEDEQILQANRQRMLRAGQLEPAHFGDWRSPDAESSAIGQMLQLADEYDATLYFVHVSVPEGVEAVLQARRRGVKAFSETCPHYLVLNDADIRSGGHDYTTSPPVRDVRRQGALRRQLASAIDVIGSDHSPVTRESKVGNVFNGQPGIPGNELMVPLMLDLAAEGAVSMQRLAALLSLNPARIFGLDHRKGAISSGLDGDLTLVDLAATTTVRASELLSPAKWSPYEGRTLRGRVIATVVRGQVVARDGRPTVDPGHGSWVQRASSISFG